ncbi:uncharacterized protein LOC106180860 [Lingula anatina]|uniref:Uncharacterized protein LOC106180860 n=1 Tax=Lingula anatina TaxID=7574 RepID=A0A1S3KDF0_LINAN|nr:uncharacterized protein LOC106180860 [Lingula anatina]|eukprot:XP_013420484.1 uncharacterized protein LOC106180860 [Lingula anatina]
MFITVKYGEGHEAIFNPQCRVGLLLNCIKERCRCLNRDIELSDVQGNVKNLRQSPRRYANEFLTPRQAFVLLQVDNSEDSEYQYIPLLKDDQIITENFMAQLAKKESKENKDRPTSSRRPTSRQRSVVANLKNRRDRDSSQEEKSKSTERKSKKSLSMASLRVPKTSGRRNSAASPR